MLRRLLSLMFFSAAIGLIVGGAAHKALTYNNKKDKNFDYNSYGNYQREDRNEAFILS
jgi:hypothetical protein